MWRLSLALVVALALATDALGKWIQSYASSPPSGAVWAAVWLTFSLELVSPSLTGMLINLFVLTHHQFTLRHELSNSRLPKRCCSRSHHMATLRNPSSSSAKPKASRLQSEFKSILPWLTVQASRNPLFFIKIPSIRMSEPRQPSLPEDEKLHENFTA